MSEDNKIRSAISDFLSKNQNSNKPIIIYPFGKYGKRVKEILNNEFGIHEFCVLDNNIEMGGARKIGEIDADKRNNYWYLVACTDTCTFIEIIKTLELNVDDENIVDIFADMRDHLFLDPTFALYDAQRKGLNLGEWLERRYNIVGRTDVIVDAIANEIDVPEGSGKFCEIGPGTGRYLQKLINRFKPSRYEFYEIQSDLKNYIINNMVYEYCKIIGWEADGKSLKDTRTASQDVVSAYNVFPILPKYSDVYRYFLEMIRVCKASGYVIFSVCTEDSYTEKILENENNPLNEWKMISKSVIENTFTSRKMILVKKYEIPYPDRVESLYIFKKCAIDEKEQ